MWKERERKGSSKNTALGLTERTDGCSLLERVKVGGANSLALKTYNGSDSQGENNVQGEVKIIISTDLLQMSPKNCKTGQVLLTRFRINIRSGSPSKLNHFLLDVGPKYTLFLFFLSSQSKFDS